MHRFHRIRQQRPPGARDLLLNFNSLSQKSGFLLTRFRGKQIAHLQSVVATMEPLYSQFAKNVSRAGVVFCVWCDVYDVCLRVCVCVCVCVCGVCVLSASFWADQQNPARCSEPESVSSQIFGKSRPIPSSNTPAPPLLVSHRPPGWCRLLDLWYVCVSCGPVRFWLLLCPLNIVLCGAVSLNLNTLYCVCFCPLSA